MKRRRTKKRTASEYLTECAQLLCKAAYRMCDESFGTESAPVEPKLLKEACSAVKEAAAVYGSAVADEKCSGDELIIRFEQNTEECSG